ncbi:hypothetical protein B0S90_1684 [Caldicellulosiruptor bescii]|jgi:hypothetical protein|uniref:Uncharacterized protein n=2 Tax=Caldicellulosiruptor bescii TaxID=31899 RepID=B9MS38_CALBD|nr:hypothetical protein [Caldicellulosiruptor bescii]ACM60492.1 hypothetical protein Athe_1392 [Caldicellulosiruptor bescii DSM 6725]PBC87904.1 hypothetical protein B0S87_0824 [Caldicellulosiruptor bescii]PBC90836.1 hypothetical protein B0S89_1186 [Caldicellulosiruptor bescii]PBD03732.1 hypothetical protein B0S85_1353 [Caldicellulosiruptor bescii]PBD06634.1 hypothetical protein B0S90_1684 [Caldicellulosiruptor bescii]
MLVVFFILYSILAFLFVLGIVKSKKKWSKIAIIIPIYLECVSLFAVYKQSVGLYGLGGLVIFIVFLLKILRII